MYVIIQSFDKQTQSQAMKKFFSRNAAKIESILDCVVFGTFAVVVIGGLTMLKF